MSAIAAAALLSGVLSLPASLAPAGATVALPKLPTGRVALTWAPLYMSDDHVYTAAEATDLARRFDLVAAMPVALQDHEAEMRVANPDLTLLAYSNATLLRTGAVAGLPEQVFAHDAAGNRITAPGFDSYLMESSDPTWKATANAQCDDRAAVGGYDGCLVDMLGLGVFAKGYVSAVPANPATGATYTESEYRDRMVALDAYYRSASPGLIHVGNAVQNSYRYWQSSVSSRGLTSGMPAAQMEDFLRGASNAVTAYPTEASWKRNIDVIRDFEAQGKVGLFTTKVWSTATNAEIDAWQRYAMASYLMGADGKSFFAFTRSRDKAGAMQTNLSYSMPRNIGLPLGDMMQRASGAWTRAFDNGESVVNPTDMTVKVSLPTSMKTLSGTLVTSVSLPPRSGEVLINAVAAPNPPTGEITSSTLLSGGYTQVTGTATDTSGVRGVSIAVQNTLTQAWLRRDGTWGSYQELGASLAAPKATSTLWNRSLDLPTGTFGVTLIVTNTLSYRTPAPRPWRSVVVP